MIRIGKMLFGMSKKYYPLNQVLYWTTKNIAIRKLNKGDIIGYGSIFKAKKNMVVAILPIGYNNGYPNIKNNKPYISINNKKRRIIGKINMNIIHVDITNINNNNNNIYYLLGNGINFDNLIKDKYYHHGYILINILRNNKFKITNF